MKEKGIKLTTVGVCCNPKCNAPLYKELMAEWDSEACFNCDPEQFREGWHPQLAELFEQTGGRLPPFVPRCTEDCCRGKKAA